jgi:2Fe-2S ferredoxin
MPRVIVTTRSGEVLSLGVDANRTLMEAIRDNGVNEVLALCSGCCSCATCHVYIDSDFADRLAPISADEDALLDESRHRRPSSRLSCQIRITSALDGLRATVAPED